MNPLRLVGVDLNLLVSLDALLTERNVTRAAQRLGISQSAMSHALRRLRVLFEDTLFLQTPKGMMPTPRALSLAEPVEQMLRGFERLLDRPHFDPRSAQRKFKIVTSDYSQLVLVPALLRHLAEHAPGIDVAFRGNDGRLATLLENGDADLTIGLLDEYLPDCSRQTLFLDEFVCLLRAEHPAARRPLTLERFLKLSHVLVAPHGANELGVVDAALARLGKERRISLYTPHFLLASHAVSTSDLVLTLPARVARSVAQPFGLRILPPPLSLPEISMSQYWHPRWQNDPAHIWFRGLLRHLANTA